MHGDPTNNLQKNFKYGKKESFPEGKEIFISKEVLTTLPEEYRETMLGDRRGALHQYRHPSGMHVREYRDGFVVHRDRFDPRAHPVRHLLSDSPETMLALGACLYGARKMAGKCRVLSGHTSEEKKEAEDTARATSNFGPLSFLGSFMLAFLSLNGLFRIIKNLIFS